MNSTLTLSNPPRVFLSIWVRSCRRVVPLQLWDLRSTGKPVKEYTGHTQDTTACVFFGATRRGVVSDEEQQAAPSAAARAEESDGGRNSPAFSASRRVMMIATASKDETVKIYDRDSGEPFLSFSRLFRRQTMYLHGAGVAFGGRCERDAGQNLNLSPWPFGSLFFCWARPCI